MQLVSISISQIRKNKGRNFNASCQRAMFRRTGWAVIWRCESGPRRGGSAQLGWPRWVCGGSGVGIRCSGASTPVPVKRPWPAGRFGVGWHLPAHPLIELIDGQGVAQRKRIDFASIEVDLPLGWTAGRGDGRWPGGLAEVFEDALNRPPVSDKPDQGHGLARTGAEERDTRYFIAAIRQCRPRLSIYCRRASPSCFDATVPPKLTLSRRNRLR